MRGKIVTSFFCLLLAAAALAGWLLPDRYYSEREKRTLTQMPQFTAADFISGKFSDTLESYLTDQVPLRDDWVTLKTYLELAAGKTACRQCQGTGGAAEKAGGRGDPHEYDACPDGGAGPYR